MLYEREKNLFWPAVSVFLPAVVLGLAMLFGACRIAQAAEAFTEVNCIKALIGEAGGQSYPELYAHACALRNRGTLRGVYGLYSKNAKTASGRTWQRASKAWSESAEGPDVTNGADHWLSEYDSKKCQKVYRQWISDFSPTTKIGQTTFYRRSK